MFRQKFANPERGVFRAGLDAEHFYVLLDDRVELFHDHKVLDAPGKMGDLFIAEGIGKAQFEVRCVGIIFLEILVGNARCDEPKLRGSFFNSIKRGCFGQLCKLYEAFLDKDMLSIGVSRHHHVFGDVGGKGTQRDFLSRADIHVLLCMRHARVHAEHDRRIELLAYRKGFLDELIRFGRAGGLDDRELRVHADPARVLLVL